jgi:hypothetical protein
MEEEEAVDFEVDDELDKVAIQAEIETLSSSRIFVEDEKSARKAPSPRKSDTNIRKRTRETASYTQSGQRERGTGR